MPQFAYTVRNTASGKRTSGILNATDREAAISVLSEKNIIITKLTTMKVQKDFFLTLLALDRVSIKGEELLSFTQELGVLLEAGIPLKKAMDILVADLDRPIWRQIVLEISSGLSSGQSLSELLSLYPDVFSKFYISMVKAGETSGNLPDILSRLGAYIEKTELLKQKIKTALYYPSVIVSVACVLLGLIFIFGVPILNGIYKSLGGELPVITKIVINIAYYLSHFWFLIILLIPVLIILARHYLRKESAQFSLDSLKLKMFILGPLFRRLAIAHFARALGSLYSSGVTIIGAMNVIAGTMGNRVLESVVLDLYRGLQEGETITEPLRRSKVFPQMAVSMIAAGDESGTLGTMLEKLANFYEAQVDAILRGLTGLVEPAFILLIGLIMGTMIIALGLPFLKIGTVLM